MTEPLAVILRPKSIEDIIGQDHLTGPGKVLSQMVKNDTIKSMIIWGPSGTGKTTTAKVIANATACDFKSLNATEAKVADIRKVIEVAEARLKMSTKTIVHIDEVHRLNASQQDVLLPSVEEGTIILIGSTTEKPVFSVNAALLSRMLVFEVRPLDNKSMMKLLLKVFKHYMQTSNRKVSMASDIIVPFINRCSGDARKMITVLETVVEALLDGADIITADHIDIAMPDKHIWIDKAGAERFDYAACWQNSVQNSDADQAIYFLAKWLLSGEDPCFIARRVLISAAEDSATSHFAQTAAVNALLAAERCGYPECRIPMALATIEIARSQRSRIACDAISAACDDVKNGANVLVPVEMRAGSHDGYVKIVNKKYVK